MHEEHPPLTVCCAGTRRGSRARCLHRDAHSYYVVNFGDMAFLLR